MYGSQYPAPKYVQQVSLSSSLAVNLYLLSNSSEFRCETNSSPQGRYCKCCITQPPLSVTKEAEPRWSEWQWIFIYKILLGKINEFFQNKFLSNLLFFVSHTKKSNKRKVSAREMRYSKSLRIIVKVFFEYKMSKKSLSKRLFQ